jgi:formylglycine-generating enzyme required for sulfatase activity
MSRQIFISYRRDDDPGMALALHGHLARAFSDERIFMDVEDGIPPGDDFVRILEERVAQCRVMLAVIGKDWITAKDSDGVRRLDNPDDFVRVEIESAMRLGKRVIPVLINRTEMPRAAQLPESMRPFVRRQAVRITAERLKADVQSLSKKIELALSELERRENEEAEARQRVEKEQRQQEQELRRKAAAEEERQRLEREAAAKRRREEAEAKRRIEVERSFAAVKRAEEERQRLEREAAAKREGEERRRADESAHQVRGAEKRDVAKERAEPPGAKSLRLHDAIIHNFVVVGPGTEEVRTRDTPGRAQPPKTPPRSVAPMLAIAAGLAVLIGIGAVIVLNWGPAAGEIAVSGPDSLDFSAPQGDFSTPPRLTLRVRAVGAGFHWTAEGPPGITIMPAQGDLAASGSEEVTLTLAPSVVLLAPGPYGQVTFKSPANTVTRPIHYAVTPAPTPSAPAQPEACGGSRAAALAGWRGRKPVPLCPVEEQIAAPKDTFRECDKCPEMVVVPAGTFVMGSPDSESGHSSDESPQHRVTIAKSFAIGRFAVTFDEWDACVFDGGCGGYKPGDEGWGRGRRPVINVSWGDVEAYTTWLSRKTGKSYRLLSEAEYEYAARAGTTTAYPWGSAIGTGNANCSGCGSQWGGRQTAPVGSFAANGFGLYDMVGNVWEWVEDCWNDSHNGAPTDGSVWTSGDCDRRVVRGGSFVYSPENLRSAASTGITTGTRGGGLGFRVARTLLAP